MLETISSRYAHAAVNRCDENCRINTHRSPKSVILKGESLGVAYGQKICDCLIFRADMKVVLAELKHKNIEPRSIHEKLTNGARAALGTCSEITDKAPALFFVVVAKSFADHTAYLRISHDRITIDNRRYMIQTAKCGCNVAEIVRDYR